MEKIGMILDLIRAGRRRLVDLLLVAAIWVCVGCGGGSVETESILGEATPIGVPDGSAIRTSIGPDGGSVASKDGKIVVNVPRGAVKAATEFAIQPITNQARGGLGKAYRLEPNGETFAVPIEVSFAYTDKDIESVVPEAFSVAYQDQSGVWQAFTTARVDQASKMVTISTSHFTDYSLWTYSLSPQKATLRVGETQAIALIGCYRANSPINRIRGWFGIGPRTCLTENVRDSSTWSANYGTIAPTGDSRNSVALYTAPAKKPSPNVDVVRFVYTKRFSDGITDVRTAEITIVDRGYRASGQDGPTAYWGVVCDLTKPFEVMGKHPLFNFPFKFVPESPTTGSMTYSAGWSMTWPLMALMSR